MNRNFNETMNFANNFVNKISELLAKSLIDKDSDKIGFLISAFIHISIIIIAIGIPSCFQPNTINIPNVVPIEILNVDDFTQIPEKPKIVEEKKEPKKIEKQKKEEIKFSSSELNEIIKVDPNIKEFNDSKDKATEILDIKKEEIIIKPEILKKPAIEDVQYESLPEKKIKPKIKPKPIVKEQKDSDIQIKLKQKPKPNFSIASVLKDLRKEEVQANQQNQEEEEKLEQIDEDDTNPSNNLTISEIDLLKQQLYGCWTVPAGTKGAKDMSVKVRVWVNPDKTVNNARILDTNRMQNDPYFRTVAESALRAALNPACKSLKLPSDKYDLWKKFIFKFELDWMLGN